MTMSHLLKRTKNCCVKLLRKFSINDDQISSSSSSSKNNNRIVNSRTTKYSKHKTKKCHKRRKITQSPENKLNQNKRSWAIKDSTDTTSSTSIDDETSNEEQNNNTNQKINLSIINNNLKNYFRLQKNNQIITNKLDKTKEKNHLNKDFYTTRSSAYTHTILDDDDTDIIFTENKIYIEKNHSNKFQFIKQLKNFHSDDNLNFTTNLMETNKCCDKIQFDKKTTSTSSSSQQSNASNYSNSNYLPDNNFNYDDIIFEKVVYDKNKKYLCHSPSLSSTDAKSSNLSIFEQHHENIIKSTRSSFDNLSDKFSFISSSTTHRPTSTYDNLPWDPWTTSSTSTTTTTSTSSTTQKHYRHHHFSKNNPFIEDLSPISCSVHFDNYLNLPCEHNTNNNNYNKKTVFDDSMISNKSSFNSTTDPWSLIDLNQSAQFSKIRKSSINSFNLLEPSNTNLLFDHFTDKNDNDKFWWDNNKISSSTLETWIDDENFDNSFNEELEKRCSLFEK